MKESTYRLIVVILLVIIAAGGCMLAYQHFWQKAEQTQTTEQTGQTDQPTGEVSDKSAPDFTVYDRDGNAVKLSDFRGKPVVLNFWASWCGPCTTEMPDFDEAYGEYGEDVHFVMINMTDGSTETVETASALIEQQGYAFPVYYDTSMEAAYAYQIYSIPMTCLIDENGDLLDMHIGMMSGEDLEQGIEMLLSE